MKIFKLPDLGEGLPDAEINEWHVKVGDTVELDAPLVSMETAKALVDVPSPRTGTVAKLYGQPGDIILTDAPLVEFTDGDEDKKPESAATVAGNIVVGDTVLEESAGGITPQQSTSTRTRAIPAVRALAKRLGVDINSVNAISPDGRISADDVKRSANALSTSSAETETIAGTVEALRGTRRAMVQTMMAAHQEVVLTSIVDDANINAWPKGDDFTVRILQAITQACQEEPALNAHFNGKTLERTLADSINIGLAVDSKDGLFVPVIKDAANLSGKALREQINQYKTSVNDRSVAPSDLQGATITLSNFGIFAGRYAAPIVVPPTVAIIGLGRLRQEAVAVDGKIVMHPMLPISLAFDHRAVTGGEASRFLGAMIKALQQ